MDIITGRAPPPALSRVTAPKGQSRARTALIFEFYAGKMHESQIAVMATLLSAVTLSMLQRVAAEPLGAGMVRRIPGVGINKPNLLFLFPDQWRADWGQSCFCTVLHSNSARFSDERAGTDGGEVRRVLVMRL